VMNQYPPDYPPTAPPEEIAYSLADGQALEIAGLEFKVLATPGHSPGGVCFHFPSAQALFCGDTLFAGSVGRTDLPGGDGRLLGQSLKKLAALPNTTRICPGHGPTSTIGEEKATNYFLQV